MNAARAAFLTLQLTFGLLTLTFGVLAMRVAPRPGASVRLGAWWMTGVTYATIGVIAAFTQIVAFPAVAAGRGSALWNVSSLLTVVGNDARGVAVFGFAVALVAHMARPRPAPGRGRTAAGLAALLAVGTALGLAEGTFQIDRQYGVMSIVSGASVVALFAALYAALVRRSMDWHLWVALSIYSVREALSAILEAARAAGYITGDWMPDPVHILWMGAASVVLMIACTLLRLGVLRAGREPPALLERLGA